MKACDSDIKMQLLFLQVVGDMLIGLALRAGMVMYIMDAFGLATGLLRLADIGKVCLVALLVAYCLLVLPFQSLMVFTIR